MTPQDIESFASYCGHTPRPAGFDAFWQARMDEADAVPLRFEVAPSEVPAFETCEYLDLWFYGMDGARLYAKYVRPRAVGPLPVVLQFHGYPGATRSWFEQSSFAGMGCAIIALDNPGQGGKSEDVGGYVGTTVAGHLVAGVDGPPEHLYYVRLYQNVRILCNIVRELGARGELDLSRVYVNGASQGGGMGIACCALNPDLVARAAILYPFLSDFRRVYELGADEIAYEGIRYYARWFDPDGSREDEWFGKLAYVETNHFAHLVRCPVLFGTGLADVVCPPQTQCAVYNELTCEKRRELYPGFGHEEIQAFDDGIIDWFDGRLHATEELEVGGVSLLHVRGETNAAAERDSRVTECRGELTRPLVLMFHDLGRPARGWHHVYRYAAIGCDVVQMQNRAGADAEHFCVSVEDALRAYDVAVALPGVAPTRVVAFGEGFGGALALAVAARRGATAVVALNPYPCEPLVEESVTHERAVPECPVLLGTSGMDEVAPPELQDQLAKRLPEVRQIHYPKYAHERINAFENEFLIFMNQFC